jgi:hypothetical protein
LHVGDSFVVNGYVDKDSEGNNIVGMILGWCTSIGSFPRQLHYIYVGFNLALALVPKFCRKPQGFAKDPIGIPM